MRILNHAYQHTLHLTMNNPIVIELESSKILPQVSTYLVLSEALQRIKIMKYVDPDLVNGLEDIIESLRESYTEELIEV